MTKRFTALTIVLIVLLASGTAYSENEFFVGVKFSVSNTGSPDLGSISPWIKVRIDQPTPNNINKFRVREIHHGYMGAAIYGIGHLWDSKYLKTIGTVLVVDDVIQHAFRVDSPIHMVNDRLYKYKWYRSIVNVGDSIFK